MMGSATFWFVFNAVACAGNLGFFLSDGDPISGACAALAGLLALFFIAMAVSE